MKNTYRIVIILQYLLEDIGCLCIHHALLILSFLTIRKGQKEVSGNDKLTRKVTAYRRACNAACFARIFTSHKLTLQFL